MEKLIKKYYEYFLKENSQENGFINFYNIIINAYDIDNDKQLKKDLEEYTKFFNREDKRGYSLYMFGSSKIAIKRERSAFERTQASFNWFIPPRFMATDNRNMGFVYSTFRCRNYWGKVYLSIKPQDYIKVTQKIQEFIDKLAKDNNGENIGRYKFRTTTVSNDAIVIRFSCPEHYKAFLDFLDENKELYDSFDEPNPFLPKDDHGLSIITDNGGSYNYFVAKVIWGYMTECKEQNKEVNINDLVRFIQEFDHTSDKIIKRNDLKTIEDYKYVLISKLTNVPDQEIINNLFNNDAKKHTI